MYKNLLYIHLHEHLNPYKLIQYRNTYPNIIQNLIDIIGKYW